MADPLKYFRVEAREILDQLQRGVLELERAHESSENVPRLLRLGHTLKGAARVVKQPEIANLAHRVEDLLVPLRQAGREATPEESAQLLALVDAIATEISKLAPAPAEVLVSPAATSTADATLPRAASEDAVSTSGLQLDDLDVLMDNVAELGFQLGGARRVLPGIERSRNLAEQLNERLDPRRRQELGPETAELLRSLVGQLESGLARVERELSTNLEQAGRELGQLRDGVDRLRLVPAAGIFGALERTTRDTAVGLGKLALFEAKGGDVRLDAEVLTAVQRALVQAVRNAVAHGIEAVAERTANGKPARGQVTLEVSRRGKQICFVCHDDGRGVDVAQVRREAERLGRLQPGASAPSDDELLSLLLLGGISTSGTVTEMSGRGVGLDLVREALAGVGGSVKLRTRARLGTSLELNVPASLSALEALLVEAGGQPYAIPLAAVVQAVRVRPNELNRTAEAVSMLYQGKLVRFIPLARLLRAARDERAEGAAWSAVLVRGEHGSLALGVDRLLGGESVVCRTLPDSVEVDPTVAGTTLDANGNPRLLLDPDGLLAAAELVPLPAPRAEPVRRAILVVDDSLTTRMLEQSILESAGYEVELATSGEQGLEKARARRYDLILVDVEMPGMDGFTFVERVRADPGLSHTPTVLVTSRASTDDIARGRIAGANAHIAKGEFDQLDFLDKIGRLIG
jgi:two-component system, chemotaxis family, sensor kinase CheA